MCMLSRLLLNSISLFLPDPLHQFNLVKKVVRFNMIPAYTLLQRTLILQAAKSQVVYRADLARG